MTDFPVTVASGAAGGGKTLLAVNKGVSLVDLRYVDKIIAVRPAIATSQLGFLPGDLNDKLDPFMRPIYDSLELILGVEEAHNFRHSGLLEVASIAHMRGRTLNDSFIILDEAQNTTVSEMKMFLTRFGENVRVVITGDPAQTDIKGENGLVWALKALTECKSVNIITFTEKHVVRSELAKNILGAIINYEKQSTSSWDDSKTRSRYNGHQDLSQSTEAIQRSLLEVTEL